MAADRWPHLRTRASPSRLLVLLVTLLASVAAQKLNATFPDTLTQCESVVISWTGGTPPYALNIGVPLSATFVGGLQYYPRLTRTSFAWNTNITQGTMVAFELSDSARQAVISNAYKIFLSDSRDNSCLASTRVTTTTTTASTQTQVDTDAITSSSATPTLGSSALSGATTIIPSSAISSAVEPTGGTSTSTSHSKLSGGGIAGIVIACAVLLALAGAGALWWRRTRHQRLRAQPLTIDDDSDPALHPASTPGVAAKVAMQQLAPVQVPVPVGTRIQPPPIYPEADIAPTPSPDTYQTDSPRPDAVGAALPLPSPSSSTPIDTPSRARRKRPSRRPPPVLDSTPRQEEDGGVRLAGGPPSAVDEEDARSTVPPPYRRY